MITSSGLRLCQDLVVTILGVICARREVSPPLPQIVIIHTALTSYRSNAEVHGGPGDPPDRGIPLLTLIHQQKLPPVTTRGRGPGGGGGGGEEAGGHRVQAALLQLHLTFVRTPARTKRMQML